MHNYTQVKNRFSVLIKKQIALFAFLFMMVSQALAQVPTNDEPCNGTAISAITLTPSAACTFTTFTNVDASNSTTTGIPNPTCANFTDADVWFTAVVPVGATALIVDTKNLGMSDGGMSIYTATGTCPSLTMTEIACADDGSSNPSMPLLTVSQPAGTRIYIRVWGFGGEVGTFGICVTANIPPTNNECTGAQALTVNPNLLCGIVAAGTTNNATQSTTSPLPPCGTTNAWNDDVWYKFVAVGPNHTISLLNVTGSSTAMAMNIYTVPTGGDCTALNQVNCVVGNLINLFGLTVGNTYYVRVFTNVTTTATANFNICIGTPPPPPSNDECLDAISLPVNPNYNCAVTFSGTTVSATQSSNLPSPTCTATNGWNDDVWYSFTATNTTHRISLLNITGGTSMSFQVYSGTCDNLVAVQCSNPPTGIANVTGLSVGTTYFIRVMTFSGVSTITASFSICIGTPPPPPANDNCANAISVTVNPNYLCGSVTVGTTTSGTPTASAPIPSCSATGADDDVWFSFVATNATQRITLNNIIGTTTALTTLVYSGTCTSLTEIACNSTNLFNVLGLTAGQTYYVRIFTTTATGAQETTFNLCIGTPPPPPANDECTGAISLTVNPNQLCAVTTLGSTAGATQSATLPTPTCSPANGWDDDVWYSFVAVSNNHSVSLLNVTGTTTNMLTTVYSGTCGNLIQIACATIDPNFITLGTLTPGQTYYVRVQTELTSQDANFRLCIGTPGPGAVCTSGNPFCSTSGVTYPSVTNQPSLGSGGIYGCLFSTPNPTWFAFQVSTPGNLVFQVSQTSATGGIDVDYAAWGPFTSQADGCAQLNATPSSQLPISCSYSTAAIETITIPNALVGQWYVVLITNFNGGAGTITFNTTTGNVGSTNCSIVCNTTASNNGPVCIGGTFNLNATAISGSTFAWAGPGFTSTQQNPTNVPAPATAGTYTYTLTTTSGTVACPATTTVVVAAPPPAPTVVSPLTYCQNANAPALTATVTTAGNTLLWYAGATGGVGAATAPIPSTATIGSITYYVSQKAGSCEGPRASITVTIVATTTPAPEVNSPVTYCQGATAASLSSNAIGIPGGSILWYTTLVGGTGSNIAPTPSTITAGTTIYYASQVIGTCESPKVAISVIVTPYSPSPTVVTPVNYCQNATPLQLTATGTNLMWYTTPTIATGSSTAPTPTTTTAGTIIYYVTQTTNGCASLRVPISVIVNANPLAPGVTSPVTYCQGATPVQLTATGTNLTWYATATAPTGTAIAPTPSTTTVGSTTYFVGAANGTCQSPRSSINVVVNATPLAPTATSPVIYCQGVTAAQLSATGVNLLWYTQPTGGASTATAPTPTTTTVGTTSYYVSSTIGICEGPRKLIQVIVNATPPAPAVVTPVTYCQSATATPLTAIGTGLLWYTNPTTGTGSGTAPTPSTLSGGSTTYYVSSTIGTCEGPRSAITVTVTATPAAPTVTSPVVYCQAAAAVPLTATGASLLWYTGPSGGIGSTLAPTPNTATPGNTTFYVTQSTAGVVCESPRAAILVTINPKPLAPTVIATIPYCQNVTAVALTATGGTGNTYLWYTGLVGGTGSSTAPTPSTSTVGSTSYYVSQTTALLCEGPRAIITVNVSPVLTVSAGNDTIIARGNTIQLNGSSTGVVNASYLWTSNILPLSLTSATILKPFANPILTTLYTLRATDPSGLCPSVTSTMKLTVVQSCINVKNAFSPNGDGINDTWFVYDQNFCLSNPGGATVTVFNRYGSKVYESKDYTNNWDGTYKGKPVPDGTYYAVIEFVLFDGKKQFVKTDVTIIR